MTIDRRALLALGGLAMTGALTGAMAAAPPAPKILYQGELLADYFQIYLRDAAHPDLPDDYSEAAIARRLVAGPYGVILHTVRNMPVPIRVTWHADRRRRISMPISMWWRRASTVPPAVWCWRG